MFSNSSRRGEHRLNRRNKLNAKVRRILTFLISSSRPNRRHQRSNPAFHLVKYQLVHSGNHSTCRCNSNSSLRHHNSLNLNNLSHRNSGRPKL